MVMITVSPWLYTMGLWMCNETAHSKPSLCTEAVSVQWNDIQWTRYYTVTDAHYPMHTEGDVWSEHVLYKWWAVYNESLLCTEGNVCE